MSPDPYEDYEYHPGGWLCLRCGAIVGLVELHNEWHAAMDHARRSPEQHAEMKALWERVAAEIRGM